MNNTTSDVRLGSGEAVRLIAGRELSTRLRSKTFIVATVATLVIIVGVAVVVKLASGGSDATVGYTDSSASLAEPLSAAADALDQSVETTAVDDEQTGRDQVAAEELDALLVGDGTGVRVVVRQNLDSDLRIALNSLARQLALDQQVAQLGGDPAEVNAAVAAAAVDVESIEQPNQYESEQLVLGILTGILIYMALLMLGQILATGVVEEKTSRVVELLLATVRPWQLMLGKVLGIGAVGLIQVVLIGTVGAAAALSLDVLTISVQAAAGTVAWLIAWYVLGFFMYALVFAALAALVSRQEEVGSVISPAMMLIIVGYVAGVSILPSDPSNAMVAVLSLIPVFAPMLMPIRLAMGGVPAWEAALSVGLVVILIPILVWLAGRIYRNAVMRSGARVKLRDALKQA